ncbi:hypothetical protein ACROYT_G005640 [Oculina patagonica]
MTKEFAVIQGPPGTGKTYIGLKIAKVLLQNAKVWRVKNGGPILVVCYTNHALDQFLEEIHEFHPQGIIRVGGRSQSEAMQKCSLTKRKREMIEKRLLPRKLGKAISEIRQEMDALSVKIMSHGRMLEKFTSNVVHEDQFLNLTSMTSKHYASLRAGSCDVVGKKESVIPQWLGLPVPPADPYQDGFAKPLVMFPFNADCRSLEYFSQTELAFVSPRVQPALGADGIPGGSLQLDGTFNSFIEIPNFDGGLADARQSITLLAFIYPTGCSGPVISYDTNGYGLQIWQEGMYFGMGILSAWFVRRDLAFAFPLKKAVLSINAWNFIGASYDHVTGMARLWHNGNEVAAVFVGQSFELATQFSIRIGALAIPWQEYYFRGRISHLHIYAKALTVSNIQAVGCISPKGEYESSEESLIVEEMEKLSIEAEGAREGEKESKEVEKTPDVRFEAYIMQNQRILETDDDIVRFHDQPPDASSDSPCTSQTPKGAEGGIQGGGWQFQNLSHVKKRIKQIIRRELNRQDAMSEEEVAKVEDVWTMSLKGRWRLYRRWVYNACESCYEKISVWQEAFDKKATDLKEVRMKEDYEVLRKADVIGMTTTGAARYHSVLQDMQPVITIVEEAAEVLEAHIITSLTPGCQHVILIGDHQQLRPSPTVYDLQIHYNLDVSLFERMVKNGVQYSRLCLQHRMRPEIAKMLDHIYVEPKLENRESVLNFENIKGVERNLFFVEHNEKEDFVTEGKSRSNVHEAKFLTALCRYFIQQGYDREKITVLTAYSGQLFKLKREMSVYKEFFEGVRVTVVDNFQGEENDIILLSLVRSERIGFLKISNRVCVALSRARKGFYIIGNAKLFSHGKANCGETSLQICANKKIWEPS